MESAQLFSNNDGQTQFWELTWARVDQFVPNLRNELFRYHSTGKVSHRHFYNFSRRIIRFPGFPSEFQVVRKITLVISFFRSER